MHWLFKVRAKILSVLATVFLIMAGVSKPEAVSNLKSWVDYFGIEDIGDNWTRATDEYVMWGAGIVLAVSLLSMCWPRVLALRSKIRWWQTGKDHHVNAGPVSWSFSVPQPTVTLRRAPWYKRIKNWLLGR